MRKILAEIRNGSFAKAWIDENEKGCPNFLAMRQREQQHAIERLGPKLRAMMPFLKPVIAPALESKAAASKKYTSHAYLAPGLFAAADPGWYPAGIEHLSRGLTRTCSFFE